MATNIKSITTSTSMGPRRLANVRMVQNFHLVWLDGTIDEANDDCRNSIMKLRQVINTVNTFMDVDECIDFITDAQDEKAFLVISGEFSRSIIPIIQNIVQLNSIYIFCEQKMQFEKLVDEWPKVTGVYTHIIPICEALKQAAHDYEQNLISISIVKTTSGISNQNLDKLDCSFMYTQTLKEILLTIDFEQGHIKDFLTYCRQQFVDNNKELKNVDLIEKEYHQHQPIWWYTYECFLYSMVNRALRLMEGDLITKIGFFVGDLHNHIAKLHAEQYGPHHHSNSFIVYRGQGLSHTDFNQLKTAQGGLLAFNNFLSTSHDANVSLEFARRTATTSDLVGILFVMTIDPSISATPFANVKNVSYYQREEEILFSMQSIFRIGQVKQIEKSDHLWQVDLTLIGDNDPQLHKLAESIRNEVTGCSGWYRLAILMSKVAQFDKAEELCEILLKQTTNEGERAPLFHVLGAIKNDQGKYAEAAEFYEKSMKINEKILPANHPDLVTSYNNIGSVYENIGEYSNAFSYYEKALQILQNLLPENHPHLATSYNNIGTVHENIGEYSKAFSYYEKALQIRQKILPANHPNFAGSYNNIGVVYEKMGEYSKALSHFEKALEIDQKNLPANHPHLATSYNNIAVVYNNMGDYSKAFSYYEEALEILQKILPENDPDLATSYNNTGGACYHMGEYLKAVSYFEKALQIFGKTLPANHPHLATIYNNAGRVYQNMGEYSKALSYYEPALDIWSHSLPPNDPRLKRVRESIETVKKKL